MTDSIMRLYLFFSQSHLEMYNNYFFPSLKDKFEIKVKRVEQLTNNGKITDMGFQETVIHKIEMIIEAILENKDNIFLYSDVDIQFFGKIEEILLESIESYDIVFQEGNRGGKGGINSGFILCRSNKKTLDFFNDVKKDMIKNKTFDGKAIETTLNIYGKPLIEALKIKNKYNVKWNVFDRNIFCGGHMVAISTDLEKFKPVPKSLLMHHATGTIGIENKLKQMEYVKRYKNKKIYLNV